MMEVEWLRMLRRNMALQVIEWGHMGYDSNEWIGFYGISSG
jgi:hypothetical protein